MLPPSAPAIQMTDDLLALVSPPGQRRVFKMHKFPQKHSPTGVVLHLGNLSGSLEKSKRHSLLCDLSADFLHWGAAVALPWLCPL